MLKDILSYVKEVVSNKRHLTENCARRSFWAYIQSLGAQMIGEFLHTLAGFFASVHTWCKNGKDKYS